MRLFLLFVFISICLLSSCTYDYFEDETNYVVYVPKVDVNNITDTYKVDHVRIFIYNQDLEKHRYSLAPFDENPRTKVGNFHFKLLPGVHPVLSFSNINAIEFSDIESYKTSKFTLQQAEDGSFKEPPVIMSDYFEALIRFPGPLVRDTAWFEHQYVGRICVAIKNLEMVNPKLTLKNIDKVEVVAGGVGTVQYLSQISDSINTRSSRMSPSDKMQFTAKLYESPYPGYEYGFQNYYLPSPDLSSEGNPSEPIYFDLTFRDANNQIIDKVHIEMVDDNYKSVVLHMAQTIVLTVDGDKFKVLQLDGLEHWNTDIEVVKDNTPGGGGIEL